MYVFYCVTPPRLQLGMTDGKLLFSLPFNAEECAGVIICMCALRLLHVANKKSDSNEPCFSRGGDTHPVRLYLRIVVVAE